MVWVLLRMHVHTYDQPSSIHTPACWSLEVVARGPPDARAAGARDMRASASRLMQQPQSHRLFTKELFGFNIAFKSRSHKRQKNPRPHLKQITTCCRTPQPSPVSAHIRNNQPSRQL